MKQIIYIIIIVFLLFVTGNFINSIYHLWNKKDLLSHFEKQLDREEAENKRLKAELSRINNPQFIEAEARDKLLLVKPGERNVIIPQENSNEDTNKKQLSTQKTIWIQWKELFRF